MNVAPTPDRARDEGEPLDVLLRRLVSPLRAITASMQLPRLCVALLLVAAVMLLGGAWDGLHGARGGTTAADMPVVAPGELAPLQGFGGATQAIVDAVQGVVRGVLTLHPGEAAANIRGLMQAPCRLWAGDRWSFIVAALVVLFVAALFGSAIARMAAVQVATKGQLGVVEALSFAASVWIRAVGALLTPLASVGLVALVMLLPALLLKVPGLNILAGLFNGLTLALGLAAAVVAIGSMITWPGLVPAVACENVDSVEALQRVLAILVRRPVQVAIMIVVALVGLAIGYLVVAGVIATTLNFTNACLRAFDPATVAATPGGIGIFTLGPAIVDGGESAKLSGTASFAAALLVFWQRLLVAFVAAWIVSYLFTAATHVYLAAREAAEGQEPADIWMPGRVRGTNVVV